MEIKFGILKLQTRTLIKVVEVTSTSQEPTLHDLGYDNGYIVIKFAEGLKSKKVASKPKPVVKRFVKPTVEEIRAYCTERSNGVDADKFWDFYEAKGWMVGKSPMKDWKACVRTWEEKRDSKTTTVKELTKERKFDA